ncbi:MAG: hypothetical protein AB8H86_28850 [Polyangiales bacterium]
MSGYRENKSCEGCGGPLQRPGYDEWGRFVCASCVARGSLMEGERRAAESAANHLNVELSDSPVAAAQQVRGILAGVMLLMSFFMCGGMGAALMGLTFYQEGETLLGLGLGLVGLILMSTPFLFALYRARRAKRAGQMGPPPGPRH